MTKQSLKRGTAAALALCMGVGMTACGGKETAGEDVKFYRANYQENLPDTFSNISGSPIVKGDTVYYAANNDSYTKYGIYSYNLTTKEEKTYFTKEDSEEYDPLAGGLYVEQYTVDGDGNIYMYMQSWSVDTTDMKDWSNATFDDLIEFMAESWGFEDTDSALESWNKYYLDGYSEKDSGYVDEDGNILYSKILTEWSSWNLPRTYGYELKKLDASGNEIYTIPVEMASESEGIYSYVMDTEVGNDGTFYMYMNQYSDSGNDEYSVLIFDAAGKQTGKCTMDSYGNELVALADGRVGVIGWADDGGYEISLIDSQTMQMDEKISLGDNYVSKLVPIDDENYLISESGSLYKLNINTLEKELYLNWVDADITSNSVNSYQLMDDGSVLVTTETYDNATYERTNEIAVVKEIPAEEAANIQVITLACIYTDSELEQNVIKLNKKNPQTRIRIKTFYEDYGDMDYEDAMAGFMTAMASDPDVDMVYFNGSSPYANMMNFAAKGLLIDLNQFLEKDSELKREDLMKSVLEACTYDDKLVGLPTGFSVSTVIGKVSDVGTEPGWTFAEMKALLDSKEPGTQLFYGENRDWALEMCLNLGYGQFIDMENANCSFNTQEFVDVLEFANLFPEEFEYNEDEDQTQLWHDGKVLLADFYLRDFEEIQLYTEIFGEEMTYIGYPTAEGNGALMSLDSCFAITKNCELPDVAWKLIREYFLPEDTENNYRWNFSVRNDEFDKFCEDAMKEDNSNGSWGWGDFMVELKPATQEQVDTVKDLVSNITAVAGAMPNDIMNIIKEEAAAYFSGNKTAEAVAETIQSRVWVYLSETN